MSRMTAVGSSDDEQTDGHLSMGHRRRRPRPSVALEILLYALGRHKGWL
jgi:hypothetical protein